MEIDVRQPVGELVKNAYRLATVFCHHGIDFCCKGNLSLEEACANKKVDLKTIINEFDQALLNVVDQVLIDKDWEQEPGVLADYIEKHHHSYVTRRTVEILPLLEKVYRVHGQQYPFLGEVKRLFEASAEDLAVHMKKEELILFPFIKRISQVLRSGEKYTPPHFVTVENPITMMKIDHMEEGERFEKIRSLTSDYSLPSGACNTFRVVYAMMEEFEKDLHTHIHLENNLLFPRIIELENLLLDKRESNS